MLCFIFHYYLLLLFIHFFPINYYYNIYLVRYELRDTFQYHGSVINRTNWLDTRHRGWHESRTDNDGRPRHPDEIRCIHRGRKDIPQDVAQGMRHFITFFIW